MPYRDVRGGGANEPHRVPRAVLRELDGRENRTGAVPHPVLHAKKAAEEASVFERSGGFVYIRNFFSQCVIGDTPSRPVSRRIGASARSTRPRVSETARRTRARRVRDLPLLFS